MLGKYLPTLFALTNFVERKHEVSLQSSNSGFKSKIDVLSLALMLLTLWLLTHGYRGLTGDGQIYAFQALARIHPQLTTDLYLQNTSQDQFTIFSPLYAWFIGLLGLESAARLLTLVFTVWFLAAAWSFARAITGRDAAWLAVAFLLIIAGDYGASGVFELLEPYLTARLPAEALTVTALACHVRGMKRLGLSLAMGALLVHPLIALPGLLLLICLWLPTRVIVISAIGGVSAAVAIAGITANLPLGSHVLTVMDSAWLEVVRERSQFLFLQLWSIHDWELNARPFICLAFTAVVVPDIRIAKLCMAAALLGGAGLAVAYTAGLTAPIAILVQGQAWRWVWITVFAGALLVPVTALQVWRDEKCGPLCATLLVSGWVLPAVDGIACVSLALIFWLTRTYINARAAVYLRWVSASLGIAIVGWILIKSWEVVSTPTPPSGHASLGVVQMRNIFGLKIPALLFGALVWWWIRTSRTIWVPTFLSAMLLAWSILILPVAFKQSHTFDSASGFDEFADWINAIPPTSNVLVAPPQDVGAFVWFTLGRPNYLAVDQSAGVVFSRATAVEVRRRSQVLLPLMDPNWKILTSLRAKPVIGRKDDATTRPLTAKILIQVCTDPRLGFVISPQDVGFGSLRHEHAGAWKDWNLYDCRKVRSAASPT
jgi:hypothetical protein